MKGGCPSTVGAKGINPASYSPKTRLMYTPLYHLCMTLEPVLSKYVPGYPWQGATTFRFSGPSEPSSSSGFGGVAAYDPLNGKVAWYNKERYISTSGILLSAGGLVFYSAGDRWFKSLDANTGGMLWKFQASGLMVGNPFSYSVKGKQFIGVMSGLSNMARDMTENDWWGKPIKVACAPGYYPEHIEESYTHMVDPCFSRQYLRRGPDGAGVLHVFSL